jgi:hypothetical protein
MQQCATIAGCIKNRSYCTSHVGYLASTVAVPLNTVCASHLYPPRAANLIGDGRVVVTSTQRQFHATSGDYPVFAFPQVVTWEWEAAT